jgi:hypothetical protein
MSIINLPNWKVLQVQETEDDYRIRAEYRSVKSVIDCPECSSRKITRHGTRPALFMDLPVHGKRAKTNWDTDNYTFSRAPWGAPPPQIPVQDMQYFLGADIDTLVELYERNEF